MNGEILHEAKTVYDQEAYSALAGLMICKLRKWPRLVLIFTGFVSVAGAAAIMIAVTLFNGAQGAVSQATFDATCIYPIVLAGGGLLGCVLGLGYAAFRKMGDNPSKELNLATWISAGITIVVGFFSALLVFGKVELYADFRLGWLSPWLSSVLGILSGIAIGSITEYYTSTDYNPTKKLAQIATEGEAFVVTKGDAIGSRSCLLPILVIGVALFLSGKICGTYGIALSSLGMLAFVGATVSIDAFGPIADNAGGLAESCHLPENVRVITDKLDAVGNTTAAIGKGFAIGSGSLAALALMISYLYAYNDPTTDLVLNIINPLTLAGAIIGAALPFLFSGMLIEAVAKAARKMVEEVRRQFKTIPGILEGKARPDYKTCISISTKGAIGEMKVPALLAIVVPVACGFIAGPESVGGLIIDRLGRIPAAGEDVTLEYGGLEFTVLEVEDRRVGKVKCTRAPELNPENDDDEEEDA